MALLLAWVGLVTFSHSAAAAAAAAVVLGPDWRVVLPAEPTETQRFAAAELVHFVQRMTGWHWAIVTDSADGSASAPGPTLQLGGTRANQALLVQCDARFNQPGRDGFVLRVSPTQVQLLGAADRATLYGVYDLLETWGCRFLAAPTADDDGLSVPQRTSLTLPLGEQRHEPWFVVREIDGGALDAQDALGLVAWSVRNRLNRRFGIRDAILRKRYPDHPASQRAWHTRGGDEQWQWLCHNFAFIFPADANDFAQHPDYFALYQGRRIDLGSGSRRYYGGGNLCTTHPEVIARCVQFTADWFTKHPAGSVMPLWPGDGAIKWCECDNCLALGGRNFMPGRDGSMTRRMIRFVNAVAQPLASRFPDRLLLLPAYANYHLPEPAETIAPNVLVQYCYHGCYAHGPGCSHNQRDLSEMKLWAQQAPGRLGVWEYFLIGDHTLTAPSPVLLPLTHRARDTVRTLAEMDARWYFTQSSPAYQDANPLLYYVLARLLWNPQLDLAALISDFANHWYGPAGTLLTQYHQTLEAAVAQSDWHPLTYSEIALPSPRVYTPQLIAQLTQLLAQAETLDLPAPYQQRVARLRTSHDFTLQHVSTQTLAGLDPAQPWRLERGLDRYLINADGPDVDPKRFDELIQHTLDTGQMDRQMEQTIFRARKRSVPVLRIANDTVEIAVLPEIGGRLIRLLDRASGRNFLLESTGNDQLERIGQRYFNYGGYEEYIGRGFAGPGWETPFRAERFENEHFVGIHLEANFDDLLLQRTYQLPRDGTPRLDIRSTLTNSTSQPRKLSLRGHPLFNLGANCGSFQLLLRREGQLIERQLAAEHDGLSVQPDGAWAAMNPDLNIALLNTFDPQQAQGYVFVDDQQRFFQLELMGAEQELAPGQSLTLAHSFHVLTDAAALRQQMLAPSPQDARPASAETRVTPLQSDIASIPDGKVGAALRLDRDSTLAFSTRYLRPNAGTLTAWVRPSVSSADLQFAFLLSAGNNSPQWFHIVLGAGQLNVLMKDGPAPYTAPGSYYASLSAEVTDWPARQWRHVAVVWADAGAGHGVLQIYLDGKLAAERYDLTLGQPLNAERFTIGRSSASARTRPSAAFDIDEWRLFNTPLTAAQVQAQMHSPGAAPTPGLLLELSGEGSAEGASRTTLPLDAASVPQRVRDILQERQP